MTPFDVFGKDIDEMIMLVNYLLDLGAGVQNEQKTAPARDDGFWDF